VEYGGKNSVKEVREDGTFDNKTERFDLLLL
jgi:hypothetical protein